jgi:threonine dehydrogenase-like Zn-dependent dehydrogenase
VFCLHPHQDRFVAPLSMLVPLPDGAGAPGHLCRQHGDGAQCAVGFGRRAGDRIVVVGAGVVGLLIARLCRPPAGRGGDGGRCRPRRGPGSHSASAHAFALPAKRRGADVVFHASVTPQGLATALGCAGFEATIVEVSWFGDRRCPCRWAGRSIPSASG